MGARVLYLPTPIPNSQVGPRGSDSIGEETNTNFSDKQIHGSDLYKSQTDLSSGEGEFAGGVDGEGSHAARVLVQGLLHLREEEEEEEGDEV